MAKGLQCPVCKRWTLQPYTANQYKCTADGTIVRKDALAGGAGGRS